MNIVAQLKAAAQVPTPPAGYAVAFLDLADNTPKVKLADGSVINMRGLQGAKGDTGAAATINGVSIQMLPPNGTPSVENTGTAAAASLLFKLPQSSILRKTATVSFANGDVVQRLRITDAAVSPSAPPCAFTVTAPSTEADDLEIAYSVVLAATAAGSFDVTVTAFDPEGGDLLGHTLPEITLSYFTGA
jgi:hypothetical protein